MTEQEEVRQEQFGQAFSCWPELCKIQDIGQVSKISWPRLVLLHLFDVWLCQQRCRTTTLIYAQCFSLLNILFL